MRFFGKDLFHYLRGRVAEWERERDPGAWGILCCFPSTLTGSRTRNGTAGAQVGLLRDAGVADGSPVHYTTLTLGLEF